MLWQPSPNRINGENNSIYPLHSSDFDGNTTVQFAFSTRVRRNFQNYKILIFQLHRFFCDCNYRRPAQANRQIQDSRIITRPYGDLSYAFRRKLGDEEIIFLSVFQVAWLFHYFSANISVTRKRTICRYLEKGEESILLLALAYAHEGQGCRRVFHPSLRDISSLSKVTPACSVIWHPLAFIGT